VVNFLVCLIMDDITTGWLPEVYRRLSDFQFDSLVSSALKRKSKSCKYYLSDLSNTLLCMLRWKFDSHAHSIIDYHYFFLRE
jgi:hypothetical protein